MIKVLTYNDYNNVEENNLRKAHIIYIIINIFINIHQFRRTWSIIFILHFAIHLFS